MVKPKIYIIGALVLLLAMLAFMVKDLFYGTPENQNPYDLNLDALRKGDSTQCMYAETQQFLPAFSEIHGIATDAKGDIYICGKDSLQIMDSYGKSKSIKAIGGTALCMHVDSSGNIFLGMEDHIEVFDPKGNLKSRWDSPGREVVITSITTSGPDVFVADAGNKIVYRYNYSGKMINKIGQKDPATGVPGFIIPSPYFDLATSEDGNLWVVNPGRHQFEKYNKEGKLLTSWNKASMDISGFCGCCNPSNIALLPGGAFVTSEKAIERVKIYDPKGNFVCLVALPSSFEEGTKGLDLAIGIDGEILVLDPAKNRVRKFTEKKKHPNQQHMQDRRAFINILVRGSLLTGVGVLSGALIFRNKNGEFCGLDFNCEKCDKSESCAYPEAAHFRQTVWQLDPAKCIQCGRCATNCVMTLSAVKCTHVYAMCGYCDLCGGYLKPDTKTISTAAENQLCPTNAIKRKFVEEPFFEYEIDEALCIGCGKCVKGCSAFGNGSLQLQIRHNICQNCNQCSIARNCPSEAFSRVPASSPYLLKGIDQGSTDKS